MDEPAKPALTEVPAEPAEVAVVAAPAKPALTAVVALPTFMVDNVCQTIVEPTDVNAYPAPG